MTFREGIKLRRIKELKKQARTFYMTYRDYQSQYDCGAALAEYLVPTMYHCKQLFNETMDELAKIDPSTPKDRL